MKLLTIEMSRVTALFRMTRPSGQPYLPHIVTRKSERYRFGSAPDSINELESNRIEFRHGLFEGSAIEMLDVYNDGIIVRSRSDTDFLDEFIDDLVAWLENDHGLSVIETHTIGKLYDSTLLVETNRDAFKPFGAYAEVCPMFENELRDSSGLSVAYHNFGFALSADQTRDPALKPVPFRFERKEGIDVSQHQYLATAPLRTIRHLAILERLEQIMAT